MKELMNELDIAYNMLSAIPVRGDYVDVMSEVRVKLRIVYQGLAEWKGEEQSGG